MKRFPFILLILGVSIAIALLVFILGMLWNEENKKERILAKLDREISYPERGLSECLVGYDSYEDIRKNWNEIRTCLSRRSEYRPFCVWLGRIGLYSSEEIRNIAIRNRVLAMNDRIQLCEIHVEGKWKDSYLVKKTTIWKMPNGDEMEVDLEFIIDDRSLDGY